MEQITGTWVDGDGDDCISRVTQEEVDMVNRIIDNLLALAKTNPSNFFFQVEKINLREDNSRYFDTYDDDGEKLSDAVLRDQEQMRRFNVRASQIDLRWEPKKNMSKNEVSPFDHVRHFRLLYRPATGYVDISSRVDSQNGSSDTESFQGTYNLGFNNTESILQLRKKIGAIGKIVSHYWKEELPRQRQENATNHFCKLFPQIVDDILLSELPDDQERDS